MAQKFIKADVTEAVAIMKVVGTALLSTSRDAGPAGANLQFSVSSLIDNAEVSIRAYDIANPLADAFTLARLAGATYAGMIAVITAAEATTAAGTPGNIVATAAVRYALGQLGRILSRTKFINRSDADNALLAIGGLFDSAETYAADNGEVRVYAALVDLHGAVSADLTSRSRLLPRIVNYSYPRTFSALSLAHRLYGDASRAAELAAENTAFNPAFMPAAGIALSA